MVSTKYLSHSGQLATFFISNLVSFMINIILTGNRINQYVLRSAPPIGEKPLKISLFSSKKSSHSPRVLRFHGIPNF